MNLKSLAIKNTSESDEVKTAYIEFEGEGVVTGADIQCDSDIEIVNPEQVIATLSGGKDNVMVSAGAKVIGSFTIGKNSKIGAGSVVIEEVPPNCTVVGVPGRIVRMGDQKVPSADLDQIHLPDPVLNDIRQLQTDNIRLKKELKALKEKLAKEKIIEEA